jgi:acetyltransferase-like isoleucine patch superfamily enzyme
MADQSPIIFIGSRWGWDFLTENCELLGIEVVGFLDKFYAKGDNWKGVECIGSEMELYDNPTKYKDCKFFLGNAWDGNSRAEKPEESGYNLRKQRIKLIKDLDLPVHSLIHPETKISRGSTFGRGCYTGRWVDVRDDVHLGDFNEALDYAAFGHDVKTGENCFVSVKGFLAGGVKTGDNCFIGCNATVVPGRFGGDLTLGNDVKVHGHAYVVKDMPDGTTATFAGYRMRRNDVNIDTAETEKNISG